MSGPYETGTEALADIRHVYEVAQRSGDRDLAGKILAGLQTVTLHEAGVTTGAYDRKIIGWLAGWQPEVVQVVLSWVERAHIAGRRAASDEVTGLRALVIRSLAYIEPCPPPDVANGWDGCAHGAWPCGRTRLAWELRGLDPDAEQNRAMAPARAAMAALAAKDEQL